jgi:hypothetical protein
MLLQKVKIPVTALFQVNIRLSLHAMITMVVQTLSIHTQFILSQIRAPEIKALLKSTCPLNPMHLYI